MRWWVIGNSSSNNDRNERLIDGNNNPNSVHIYDDKEKHHDNHSELKIDNKRIMNYDQESV